MVDFSPYDRARDGDPDERTLRIARAMTEQLTEAEIAYALTMRWERMQREPLAIFADPTWVEIISIALEDRRTTTEARWSLVSSAQAQSCAADPSAAIVGLATVLAGATLATACGASVVCAAAAGAVIGDGLGEFLVGTLASYIGNCLSLPGERMGPVDPIRAACAFEPSCPPEIEAELDEENAPDDGCGWARPTQCADGCCALGQVCCGTGCEWISCADEDAGVELDAGTAQDAGGIDAGGVDGGGLDAGFDAGPRDASADTGVDGGDASTDAHVDASADAGPLEIDCATTACGSGMTCARVAVGRYLCGWNQPTTVSCPGGSVYMESIDIHSGANGRVCRCTSCNRPLLTPASSSGCSSVCGS